jgi:hypothetical protein
MRSSRGVLEHVLTCGTRVASGSTGKLTTPSAMCLNILRRFAQVPEFQELPARERKLFTKVPAMPAYQRRTFPTLASGTQCTIYWSMYQRTEVQRVGWIQCLQGLCDVSGNCICYRPWTEHRHPLCSGRTYFHTTAVWVTSKCVDRRILYKIVTADDQSDGHLPPGCMSLQNRTLICSRPYFCSYVSYTVPGYLLIHRNRLNVRQDRPNLLETSYQNNNITAGLNRRFWLAFETLPVPMSNGLPIIPIGVVKVPITSQRPLPSNIPSNSLVTDHPIIRQCVVQAADKVAK